jgi:uncharacterized protein (DUF2384 family)
MIMKTQTSRALRALAQRLRQTDDDDFISVSRILSRLEAWSSITADQFRIQSVDLSPRDVRNIRAVLADIVGPRNAPEPLTAGQVASLLKGTPPLEIPLHFPKISSPETNELRGQRSSPQDDVPTGYSADVFTFWAKRFGMSQKTFAERLGLNVSAIYRSRSKGRPLPQKAVETIDRIDRIWEAASRLFTTDEAVADNLTRPDQISGATPLDASIDETSTQRIEEFYVGLAHGMFQ